MKSISRSDFDWEALYDRLEEVSQSLESPDRNLSIGSFHKAFALASQAEAFTTYTFTRFSKYKRATKDKIKRLQMRIKIGSTVAGTGALLSDSQLLFEEINVFMAAINKVSGRIKHFREDLGRMLKLREMDGSV